jgi:hypothetical protein
LKGWSDVNDDDLKRLEGPALSCITATICALAIAKVDNNVWLGALYWLIFVVISGLFVDPRYYESVKQFIVYCMAPAGWLAFVWVALPVIAVIWGGSLNTALVYSLLFLMPIVFVSSCVGIAIGALARRRLIEIITEDEAVLSKLDKNLIALGALATLVYGGMAWFIKHVPG